MTTVPYSRAESRRGLLFIVITALLWGTVGIAGRAINELAATNALSIGFFRLAFAVPVLALACWRAVERPFALASRADLGLILLLGTAMALYQVCYFAAVAVLGVTIAVMVAICTAPVMVALLSALLLRERLTFWVLLALACAVAGTVLLVQARPVFDEALQQASSAGIALSLGAGLSYAVVTICGRVLSSRYHPLQSTSLGFAIGTLLLLPFALANGLVISYPAQGWLLLLFLGVVPTALGYLLFLSGLRTATATAASITTLLEPLTSAVLAWLFFREQLGPPGWLGALLLLGAMALLVWRPAAGRQ